MTAPGTAPSTSRPPADRGRANGGAARSTGRADEHGRLLGDDLYGGPKSADHRGLRDRSNRGVLHDFDDCTKHSVSPSGRVGWRVAPPEVVARISPTTDTKGIDSETSAESRMDGAPIRNAPTSRSGAARVRPLWSPASQSQLFIGMSADGGPGALGSAPLAGARAGRARPGIDGPRRPRFGGFLCRLDVKARRRWDTAPRIAAELLEGHVERRCIAVLRRSAFLNPARPPRAGGPHSFPGHTVMCACVARVGSRRCAGCVPGWR